ncbi:MAG TPA: sterol desaturase family protein [Methylocella sp.]|nr:sterol desaturase family protein [Methylocella sp.]
MMTSAPHDSANPPADDAYLRASPRLFENPVLDKLSRVHWSVPLWIYGPVIVVLAGLSLSNLGPWWSAAGLLLGYFIWTLTEYLGHRFLFHYEFPGRLGARIHLLIHGIHHTHPNDPLRLVMPALLSGPIMLIAFAVASLLFGLPLGYAVLTGFILGYISYDMVHYYVHHGRPKSRLGLMLRRAHMLHHFRDPARGFGVSAPWWDYVFNTAYRPER